MQIELIPSPPAITRATARANAMQAARQRAECGIAAAARVNSAWCVTALEALRKFAAGQVGMWTIEMARSVIEQDLDKPSDGRAWGFVTQAAVRAGYIVKTDKTAPAASSNGSGKPLFKRGPSA